MPIQNSSVSASKAIAGQHASIFLKVRLSLHHEGAAFRHNLTHGLRRFQDVTR